MTIYISSTVAKHDRIIESLKTLANFGFEAIELSGGSNYHSNQSEDILNFCSANKNLKVRLHNYCPPPVKSFVLNLCSSGEILNSSKKLIEEALQLSSVIGATEYGIHAGFRIQPNVKDLGGIFSGADKLLPQEYAEDLFLKNMLYAQARASQLGISLYVENNVVTLSNFEKFGKQNPFLLCSSDEYVRMNKASPFKLLLDVGHLKVSCKTLGLNFERELSEMLSFSDYIHLSENAGLADENMGFSDDSHTFSCLKNLKSHLKNKKITLEIYSSLDENKKSFDLFTELIG